MDADAGKSFALALIGFLVCFLPFLQIISIVFYFRARALARPTMAAVSDRVGFLPGARAD